MKTVLSILFFVACSMTTLSAQQSGTLQLTITNVEDAKGKILVAFFNEAGTFLTDDRYRGVMEEVNGTGTIKISVPDLPFGEYAISIFHDENDNDELDSNWMGIPKEPYAFSNNAKGNWGPPSYQEAAFTFEKDQQTHSMELK